MQFLRHDGGRAAAGYKGEAGDCVVRAIAIATGKPYQEVYDAINATAAYERPRNGRRSSARTGVQKATIKRYLTSLGWTWTPTMAIGNGCKVHLRAEELPVGRLIVSVSKHLVAVIDGVIHDTHDCSRDGTRCVYGYWHKECLQPPVTTFTSKAGHIFTVTNGQHEERFDDTWPIFFEGQPAGKLYRNLSYGKTVEGLPRWQASTRELFWARAVDAPRGIGFDVAAFDTAEQAVAAWAQSADQILDWAEGKPVKTIYAKTGVVQRG